MKSHINDNIKNDLIKNKSYMFKKRDEVNLPLSNSKYTTIQNHSKNLLMIQ